MKSWKNISSLIREKLNIMVLDLSSNNRGAKTLTNADEIDAEEWINSGEQFDPVICWNDRKN